MTQPDPVARPNRSLGAAWSRRPGLLLAIVAIVILTVGIFGYQFLRGQQPTEPQREQVAEFSGEGDHTTSSFTVGDGWQIHWETEGDRFAFAIKGDFDFGTVIEQDAAGSGITSPVPTGTFHLEITASGPWSVVIYQPR